MAAHFDSIRPAPDRVLAEIADYVLDYVIDSELACDTAHLCLLDTLGCGMEALDYIFGQGAYAGRDVSDRPTLILLDLRLAKVDDIEVLRRIR